MKSQETVQAKPNLQRKSVRRIRSCENIKTARDPSAIGAPMKRVMSTVCINPRMYPKKGVVKSD